MMSKIWILLIAAATLMTECANPHHVSRLDVIDSLLAEEMNDSAYHEMLKMQETDFVNDKDKAHYQLLLTRTSYLTNNTLATDSMIDAAISYYEKEGLAEELGDAYYYKASCEYDRGHYQEAITLLKKAEQIGQRTNNIKLLYKTAESIAYINDYSGNYNLQLKYAHRALEYAKKAANKNWMAYSYLYLSQTFQNMGETDSMTIYAKELIARLDDVYPQDKSYFLSCIGYMYYQCGDLRQAEKYYKDALQFQETALTMENLADVYIKENREEDAYHLWQKSFLMNDGTPKDIVMLNMLQYDLRHHQPIEDACERLYRIFSIKDSINNTLKDRTIQELQQRYDEETTQRAYETKISIGTIILLLLIVIILSMTAVLIYRRKKQEATLASHQMDINNYQGIITQLDNASKKSEKQINEYKERINGCIEEIKDLKATGDKADKKIAELNDIIDGYQAKIQELNDTVRNEEIRMDTLRLQIKDIVEKASPILNRGKILHDCIENGETTVRWSRDDFKCYVEYYKAAHYPQYAEIIKQYKPKTTHNTFFLILCKTGKNDVEIGRVMNISKEAIRSIRYRIRNHSK